MTNFDRSINRTDALLRPLLLGAVLSMALAAPGQSGGGYDLSWSTIDSGAGVATGAGYTLVGTIGQPEAAPVPASGGGYSLTGGFLQPSVDPSSRVGEWALY
jgi:uncharacterized protein YbjT (DUF2867 family)